MDFRKIASGAETLFNRAKQYTEEKLGQAEKTDYDAPFEMLLDRAEKTKKWTETILKQTETVLTPNPSARVEEFVYEKVQGSKPQRMLENDVLGQNMIDAGNEFGPGTAYGSALVKCGQTQQKLGQAKREFMQATTNNFLQQLKAFLDTDMKTVMKEKKTLESKRLDLDAAKAKCRRAKTQPGKETPPAIYSAKTTSNVFSGETTAPLQEEDLIAKAEAEVRVAQIEFDRQVEATRLLLEGISSTHAHHLHCLHDFIEAEATYYAQCQQYMVDLQKQLGSYRATSASGGSIGGDSGFGSTAGRISPPNFLPPAVNQYNSSFSGY